MMTTHAALADLLKNMAAVAIKFVASDMWAFMDDVLVDSLTKRQKVMKKSCYRCSVLLTFVFLREHKIFFILWRVPRFIQCFSVSWIYFPYFTNVVQLLCSLSGWLHLNCSTIGTGFNGAETNYGIAHGLGILLINSNCFSTHFQRHM